MKIAEYRKLREDNPEAALNVIDQLVKGHPEDYLYLLEAASAAEKLGLMERALDLSAAACKSSEGNSHAAYCRSLLLIRLERVEEGVQAATHFLKTRGFHSDCFDILINHNPYCAYDMVKSVVDRTSRPIRFSVSLAALCYKMGDIQQAIAIIEELSPYPQHRSRYLLSAMIHSGSVRPEVARPSGQLNRVVQYWDQDRLPDDVRALVDRVGSFSHDHQILHNSDFEKFVRRYYGLSYQRVIDLCSHPAAQSDVARLIWLYENGGVYIDADMFIRGREGLLVGFGRLLLLVADNLQYPCVTNWALGAKARDLFLAECIEAIPRLASQKSVEKLTVFDLTGPGVVTHCYVESLLRGSISNCLYSESSMVEHFRYSGNLGYKESATTNWAKDIPDDKVFVPGDLLSPS